MANSQASEAFPGCPDAAGMGGPAWLERCATNIDPARVWLHAKKARATWAPCGVVEAIVSFGVWRRRIWEWNGSNGLAALRAARGAASAPPGG